MGGFYPIALYAKIENSCKISQALKTSGGGGHLLQNLPILIQNFYYPYICNYELDGANISAAVRYFLKFGVWHICINSEGQICKNPERKICKNSEVKICKKSEGLMV